MEESDWRYRRIAPRLELMTHRFTLDAYAARSCPVKTQNKFHPGITLPALDEDLTEKFSGGQDYEAEILSAFCSAFTGTIADLRPLRQQPWQEQEQACREAMTAGVEAIIGGVLPLDLAGHRSGKADLWLRGPDATDGVPGYYPVEVKSHQILERRQGSETFCSTLSTPFRSDALAISDTDIRFSSRELDLIQMAHYYRQLQAAGVAAGGEPFAAIIGRDQIGDAGEPMLSWIALSERKLRTFSRSSAAGWKLRAPLERYDHEHGFRVRVAQHALCQSNAPDSPPLMVRPIAIRECGWCPWWEVCRPALGDDDLSVRIDKSPLDVREISVLRSLGISTVSELAHADLDVLLPTYLPETAHRHGSEGRLRLAHRRARLLKDGIELERVTDGPIEIPSAPIEIDFDIETTAGDRVYLWGFLLTDKIAHTQEFIEFSRFTELDESDELELAAQAMAWLRDQVEKHPELLVYHYSDYETVRIRRLTARSDADSLKWAISWLREGFVDLFTIVKENYFGTHGLGLKVIASAGAGFHWRDNDPGGLNSQTWFDEALNLPTEEERQTATRRVLEYNEDDVRATWALREWMKRSDTDSC